MRKITPFIFLLILSCSTQNRLLLSMHTQLLANLPRGGTGIMERVAVPSGEMLSFWKEYDQRPDYTAYAPGPKEREIIARNLALLPPRHRAVLRERLIGIYFVGNFMGSGVTDWVLKDGKRLYCYIILNPALLSMDLSATLTWRERSCFRMTDPAWTLAIDCGKQYDGLLYVLLHEASHVVDYVTNVTPYVEEKVRHLNPGVEETGFTRGIWSGIASPAADLPWRKDLTFYGFGGGPKIPVTDAPAIYRGLAQSPFVSLYGSTAWIEDFADYLTFYHITQKLGMPYVITVQKGKEIISRTEPLKNGAVAARFPLMERFYRE